MRTPWLVLVVLMCFVGCSTATHVYVPLAGNPQQTLAEGCVEKCRPASSKGRGFDCLSNCPGAYVAKGECLSAQTPPAGVCRSRGGRSVGEIVVFVILGLGALAGLGLGVGLGVASGMN